MDFKGPVNIIGNVTATSGTFGTTYMDTLGRTTTAAIAVSNPLAMSLPDVTGSSDGNGFSLTQIWNTTGSGKVLVANIVNNASYQFGYLIDINLTGTVGGGHIMTLSTKGDFTVPNCYATSYMNAPRIDANSFFCLGGGNTSQLRISGGANEQMQWGASGTGITTATLGLGGLASLGPALIMVATNTNGSSLRWGYIEFQDTNTNDATSGTFYNLRHSPTINQASGSATTTMLQLNPTVTAAGSGGVYFAKFQRSSVDKWWMDDQGTQTLFPRSTTPANPASSTEARIYLKGGIFVFQYNDAGTVRYKYLDLTSTGVTWTHSTTAP